MILPSKGEILAFLRLEVLIEENLPIISTQGLRKQLNDSSEKVPSSGK